MEQKGHQICDQHNKVAIKHIIDITYLSKTKNLLDSVIIYSNYQSIKGARSEFECAPMKKQGAEFGARSFSRSAVTL